MSKCNKVKFIRPTSLEVNNAGREKKLCWAYSV
jgi:hypothetical protein